MTRRSRDWNKELAKDLIDQKFAQGFLIAAMKEDVPLLVALGKVIRAYGIKEFAEKVGIASPNLVRAINPKNQVTKETLDRLLKPFGLKIGLIRTDDSL